MYLFIEDFDPTNFLITVMVLIFSVIAVIVFIIWFIKKFFNSKMILILLMFTGLGLQGQAEQEPQRRYTINQILSLMNQHNLDCMSRENLNLIKAHDQKYKTLDFVTYEPPEEVQAEFKAVSQARWLNKSEYAIKGIELDTILSRFDKIQHINSGKILEIRFVANYGNGDVIHSIKREKPFDSEFIIETGDGFIMIK